MSILTGLSSFVFEIEKISGGHEDFVKPCCSLESSNIEPSKGTYDEPNSLVSDLNLSKFNNSCLFCLSTSHRSNDCNKFSNPQDFQATLFKNFLCYNCFQQGHKAYACPQAKQCSLCFDPRKHSRIVCNRNFD